MAVSALSERDPTDAPDAAAIGIAVGACRAREAAETPFALCTGISTPDAASTS
jgi:hypothetical protein